MPLQPSTIYFCPWQMSQSAFLPVKPYILIGNHVRVKSSGLARGLANARPPGSATFANAPPPGLTRWANAPQLPGGGGGGGGGGLGAGGIDWCIICVLFSKKPSRRSSCRDSFCVVWLFCLKLSVLKNLQHSSTNETHHDFFYSEKYLQKTELRRGQRFLAALPFSI